MPSTPLPSLELNDDELAVALAEGAGAELLALRAEIDAAGGDYDGKELKAAGDRASQAWLAAALSHTRPHDAVLSEEAQDDPARLAADRVWIIDPLDGTREFSERYDEGGWRDDFAVHIALWERGKGLTVGAVALPARGQVFSTMNANATDITTSGPLRVAASRTRPPSFVAHLAKTGQIALAPMGSAGVKVISVVDGSTDAYLHGGGQYEWDSAAPVAVAQAAGLVCTRLDGTALQYNRADPWLPDLFVTRPEHESRLRQMLANVDTSARCAG